MEFGESAEFVAIKSVFVFTAVSVVAVASVDEAASRLDNPRLVALSGSKATTLKIMSVGSAPDAVAWRMIGPSVFESVALAATEYQPLPTSETAPAGVAKVAPPLEIVTVGVRPVLAEMWSDES